MPVVIQCPHCKSKINAPEKKVGTSVNCPKCKKGFRAVAYQQSSEMLTLISDETPMATVAPAATTVATTAPAAAGNAFAFDELASAETTDAPAGSLAFDEPATVEEEAPVVAAGRKGSKPAVRPVRRSPRTTGGGGPVEVLMFQAYLAPVLAQVFFWGFSAFSIFMGLQFFTLAGELKATQAEMASKLGAPAPTSSSIVGLYVLGGAFLVLGPIFARLMGEGVVLAHRLFRSYEEDRRKAASAEG